MVFYSLRCSNNSILSPLLAGKLNAIVIAGLLLFVCLSVSSVFYSPGGRVRAVCFSSLMFLYLFLGDLTLVTLACGSGPRSSRGEAFCGCFPLILSWASFIRNKSSVYLRNSPGRTAWAEDRSISLNSSWIISVHLSKCVVSNCSSVGAEQLSLPHPQKYRSQWANGQMDVGVGSSESHAQDPKLLGSNRFRSQNFWDCKKYTWYTGQTLENVSSHNPRADKCISTVIYCTGWISLKWNAWYLICFLAGVEVGIWTVCTDISSWEFLLIKRQKPHILSVLSITPVLRKFLI